MFTKRPAATALFSGVIALGGAILSPGAGVDSITQTAAATIAVFDEPQTTHDKISDEIAEIGGIVPASSRLLGYADNIAYWVGQGATGDEICVIVELPNGPKADALDAPVTGSVCTERSMFLSEGTSISLDGYTAKHGVVAYVMPANIDKSHLRSLTTQVPDLSIIHRSSISVVAIRASGAEKLAGIQVGAGGSESYSFMNMEICGQYCG